MHDFGHHCIDLYKIVSRVILNCNSAYNNGNGMKSREFYILNIAILLHDIGMNKVIDMNRGKHSYDSADFIKKEYNICSSPLAEEQSGLTRNEIAGLRRIVQAHSDGNDPSVPNCERGLNNPKIQENLNGKEVIIREKLLAFILRLADELDVTSDRIGHSSIEEELENAEERCQDILYKLSVCNHDEKEELEKQRDIYFAAKESLEHWKLLYLFQEIKREEKDGKAYLIVDDEYIEQRIQSGDSIQNLADQIERVYGKIKKEFDKFEEFVNSNLIYSGLIGLKQIIISTGNKELHNQIMKKEGIIGMRVAGGGLVTVDLNNQNLDGEEKTIQEKNNEQDNEQSTLLKPTVISPKCSIELEKFIEERNLFQVGHFLLQDSICARNWIDIAEIIETEKQFRKCIQEFVSHIQKKMSEVDDYIIVGLDAKGMLIASRIAFILNRPFSYVVPAKAKKNSGSIDNDLVLKEEKVILVTDAISTFDTVNSVITEYSISDKVKAIYALFFRNSVDENYIQYHSDLVKMTYILNDTFDIEIYKNNNCRYKDTKKCKACNKKVY